MIRVLIVDDHTMVRESLRWGCEHAGMVVVAEAADGEDALVKVDVHHPDIVLMDLSLPRVSGVAAAKRIRAQYPRMAILMLSMLSDESAVSSALSAGANGYMTKDSTMAQIIDAVIRVASGQTVLFDGYTPPMRPEPQPSTTVPGTAGISGADEQTRGGGASHDGHRRLDFRSCRPAVHQCEDGQEPSFVDLPEARFARPLPGGHEGHADGDHSARLIRNERA